MRSSLPPVIAARSSRAKKLPMKRSSSSLRLHALSTHGHSATTSTASPSSFSSFPSTASFRAGTQESDYALLYPPPSHNDTLSLAFEGAGAKPLFHCLFAAAALALQIPACYVEIAKFVVETSYQTTIPVLVLVSVIPSLLLSLNNQQEGGTAGENELLSLSANDSLLKIEEYYRNNPVRSSSLSRFRDDDNINNARGNDTMQSQESSSNTTSTADEWGQFFELDDELPPKDLSFVVCIADSSPSSPPSNLVALRETEEEEEGED